MFYVYISLCFKYCFHYFMLNGLFYVFYSRYSVNYFGKKGKTYTFCHFNDGFFDGKYLKLVLCGLVRYDTIRLPSVIIQRMVVKFNSFYCWVRIDYSYLTKTTSFYGYLFLNKKNIRKFLILLKICLHKTFKFLWMKSTN